MSNFSDFLNNVIEDLNFKYGFDIEASDFKPELIFSYGDYQIPKEPGKRDGDSRGVGHTKMFWHQKFQVWLPKDVFNATRSVSADSAGLPSLSVTDKNIILEKLKGVKGNLDVMSFVSEASNLYGKALESDDPKIMTEINKEIKDSLSKFNSKNAASISSRTKVIKDITESFGESVGQSIKRLILRADDPSKIKSIADKGIKEKKEKYEPELDPNQKQFSKNDRKYILNVIKQYHKEGVPAILKRLIGKYPKHLLEELKDASEKYGDVKGLADYLADYESLRDELKRWQGVVPEKQPGKSMPGIATALKPIEDFINKVKNKLEIENYDDTFLAYTERLLKAVKDYSKSNKKIPELEWAIVDILGGEEAERRDSFVNAWRDARVPGVTKFVTQLPHKLSDIFDFEKYEISESDLLEDPQAIYRNLKKLDSKPPYLKEILDLKNKPIKFENIVIEDETGDIVEDVSRLNLEDKELAEQVKSLLREDKKDLIKRIRDEGLTEEEIKERSKRFRDTIKNENREELLKNINELDAKELEMLESKFEFRKKNISELRKELRQMKKLDQDSLKNHLTKLKRTLSESDDDQKIVKKIDKLEKDIKALGTMTDKQKEDVKKSISEMEDVLEQSLSSKKSIQDMLKRFNSMDSWLSDMRKKKREFERDEKLKKNREVDLSELTDAEIKDYIQKFQDAMIVHYIKTHPEIVYKTVPNEDMGKKIDKLEKDLQKLKDKEEKNKKDLSDIKELEERLSKMEQFKNKREKRDVEDSVEEIKKLRQRLQDLYDGKGKKLMITPEDYIDYVNKAKVEEEEMKKILEKADVDFQNLMKRNMDRFDVKTSSLNNILKEHSSSILYKIEKSASQAPNMLIKAELSSIHKILKDII